MSDEHLLPDERRKFKRRAVNFVVRYRTNAEGVITGWNDSPPTGGNWDETKAENISAGGLFLTFGKQIRPEQILDLEFYVEGRSAPIKVKAKIVRMKVVVPDTMFECGLEFTEIKPEDRQFLDDFASQA